MQIPFYIKLASKYQVTQPRYGLVVLCHLDFYSYPNQLLEVVL